MNYTLHSLSSIPQYEVTRVGTTAKQISNAEKTPLRGVSGAGCDSRPCWQHFGDGFDVRSTPDYPYVGKCILRELCALALVESTPLYLC